MITLSAERDTNWDMQFSYGFHSSCADSSVNLRDISSTAANGQRWTMETRRSPESADTESVGLII